MSDSSNLLDPMDCSLPGSSVHGIFQARILEWGATAFSRKGLGSANNLLCDLPEVLEYYKITADGDCSHEIKRRLLLGRKAMTNLDSILKSRDIALPTKVRLVKAMVFPVVMYGCESWTIKLSAVELMLLNSGVGEDSGESLGLQGNPTSPF